MRAETAENNKSRPQRGGGFSLNLYLPGVSRWSGVISHDISRYIVISYSISCDVTRYDISRYCIILIPNFWDWYRDIVCRRNISRYRTLFFAHLGAQVWCTRESKKWLFGGRTSEAVIFIGGKKMNDGWTQSADLDAILRNNNITHYAKSPPHHFAVVRLPQQRRIILHWSWTSVLVIEESWTPPPERQREMDQEKSDAALANVFDGPSFPFIFIGSTSGSCAGTAWVEHSSGFFRHEAPVNVGVFLHEFAHTIPGTSQCTL